MPRAGRRDHGGLLGGESGVDDVRARLETWHRRQLDVGRDASERLAELAYRGQALRGQARELRKRVGASGAEVTGTEADALRQQLRELDQRIERRERQENAIQDSVQAIWFDIYAFESEIDTVAARHLSARAEAVLSAVAELTEPVIGRQPSA
jgi:chromosome segregation ATPase